MSDASQRAEEALTEARKTLARALDDASGPSYRVVSLMVDEIRALLAETGAKQECDGTYACCCKRHYAPLAPPAASDEVREALAPFAAYGSRVDPHIGDAAPIGNNLKPYLTFGDVRRATRVLAALSRPAPCPACGRTGRGCACTVEEREAALDRPAPEPVRNEVAEAAEIIRAILTGHSARLSERGVLIYGQPLQSTGFPAAIEWLRRYDAALSRPAAKGGE